MYDQCKDQFNFILPSVALERRLTKFMHAQTLLCSLYLAHVVVYRCYTVIVLLLCFLFTVLLLLLLCFATLWCINYSDFYHFSAASGSHVALLYVLLRNAVDDLLPYSVVYVQYTSGLLAVL